MPRISGCKMYAAYPHFAAGLLYWISHGQHPDKRNLRTLPKLFPIGSGTLLSVVESWLRSETKHEKKKPIKPLAQNQKASAFGSSPFVSSRHMAYYRWSLFFTYLSSKPNIQENWQSRIVKASFQVMKSQWHAVSEGTRIGKNFCSYIIGGCLQTAWSF